MEEWLRIGGYVGSMLTSMIAAGASAVYWVDKRSKRRRLEDYLKARKERSPVPAGLAGIGARVERAARMSTNWPAVSFQNSVPRGAAPHSTTNDARMAAWSVARPCTRCR